MNRSIPFVSVLFCYQLLILVSVEAQTLYGTTFYGGDHNAGTINKFIPATNNLIVAKSFENIETSPGSSLIQAGDGKLYGTTRFGESTGSLAGVGAIFSYDPASSTYTKLKDFRATDGNPQGSLIEASDGKLYGTAGRGYNMNGVIFSYDLSADTYTNLKVIDGNGNGVIQASDGKLYGTTWSGGSSDVGVIFSFDLSTSSYEILKDFTGGANGRNPVSLMQASDGKLYGLTSRGGKGAGVIFSFDLATSTYKKLKDFNGSNGADPSGILIEASDGLLYGTTNSGGSNARGVIFSFNPVSSIYTKLNDFDDINGANPQNSLTQAVDGKLYGMTYSGGSIDAGVIFSFDPLSSMYKKLKDFDGTNGARSRSRFVQASDGKLYGMTYSGGSNEAGVIFSFNPLALEYTKLKDFGTNETGSNASAGLVQAGDGQLYGVTAFGGSSNKGVIFSFDPLSSTQTKLKDFDGINGANPRGSLMQANNGKLYGMTESGGTSDYGVIFSFDPLSAAYTKLKDFDGTNGREPLGSLIQASDGKLYGMTVGGGSSNKGTIFSYELSSATYAKLKDFDGDNSGARPNGSLVQASDGKLYGVTRGGGINSLDGVIFSYDIFSSTYTKLKDFGGNDDVNPEGNLIQLNDGKLYGMTRGGIFSFDPSTTIYTKLKHFDDINDSNGSRPAGSLMQASTGVLFGNTERGGVHGNGVIFSFDPSTSTYTKLKDYNGVNGATPGTGSAFIEIKESSPFVALISPANNAIYLAGGNVYVNAAATDTDGTISKVEFYNGSTLLYTAKDTPYTFKWQKINTGTYILTAKVTDNSGMVATSAPINISVVLNKPPTVSIITPAKDQTFTSPANIHFEAVGQDTDGRVTTVEFYNGSTALTLERKVPYTYDWANVPAGTYSISARATDNWGAVTTSAPVTVVVTANTLVVSNRPSLRNRKIDIPWALGLQVAPNPAKDMVKIYTTGWQKNKQTTLSVISASGVIMKTMKLPGLAQTISINVSSLASGIYTVKLLSGDRVMYARFVKM